MKAERLSEWLDAGDKPPTEVGWYAVIWSFDANEGCFPGSFCWDGAQWLDSTNSRGVVVPPVLLRSPQSFAEEADAMDWAREHDPEI